MSQVSGRAFEGEDRFRGEVFSLFSNDPSIVCDLTSSPWEVSRVERRSISKNIVLSHTHRVYGEISLQPPTRRPSLPRKAQKISRFMVVDLPLDDNILRNDWHRMWDRVASRALGVMYSGAWTDKLKAS